MKIEEIAADEATFRHEMNQSKMATDLLSAGIRKFVEDGDRLKTIIRKQIEEVFESPAAEKNEEGRPVNPAEVPKQTQPAVENNPIPDGNP